MRKLFVYPWILNIWNHFFLEFNSRMMPDVLCYLEQKRNIKLDLWKDRLNLLDIRRMKKNKCRIVKIIRIVWKMKKLNRGLPHDWRIKTIVSTVRIVLSSLFCLIRQSIFLYWTYCSENWVLYFRFCAYLHIFKKWNHKRIWFWEMDKNIQNWWVCEKKWRKTFQNIVAIFKINSIDSSLFVFFTLICRDSRVCRRSLIISSTIIEVFSKRIFRNLDLGIEWLLRCKAMKLESLRCTVRRLERVVAVRQTYVLFLLETRSPKRYLNIYTTFVLFTWP